MILCLDIGNSQIYGGVFAKDNLLFQFRRSSKSASSSDEIGVFLRSVLRENDIEPDKISKIAVCTVVPEVLHSLKNACRKYFNNLTPFVLQAGVKTGLNIKYRNPLELGADRIANAIAGTQLYPQENLIIIDMGTATTFCAINSKREFLGGAIIPGLRISMTALEANTSKLPTVEIMPMTDALARSTIEGIQSGLYFSSIGAIKEIVARLREEAFAGEPARVVGTGGFASLFHDAQVFDEEIPDLVLKGLYLALVLNESASRRATNATQHAEV
jgi:type III pantothenate kinase